MDPKQITARLFEDPAREFDVQLWDGTLLPQRSLRGAAGSLILQSPDAVGLFAPLASEVRMAQAFVEGDLDVRGDLVAVLEALARWKGPRLRPSTLPPALASWATRVLHGCAPANARPGGRRHSPSRDASSVQYHYDLSDDFYRLFLDRRMVYSCAYFPRGDETLDRAQEEKLELTCRKLNLRPGDKLLDVGCGWGGLLVYAARNFGVSATGITLSSHQSREAIRLADAAQVTARVRVLEQDYRRLAGQAFDKVASIGMMEHVGEKRLDDYFGHVYRRVQPGGLFLNHAIAQVTRSGRTVPWLHRWSGGFIDRQIFPDAELPSLAKVLAAAERQGFEVRDVECLREHYAQTLRLWLRRLEDRFGEATKLVGVRRARAWRLYLAGSAAAFRLGRVGIYQTLLARRSANGAAVGVPRTRRSWYDEWHDETAATSTPTPDEIRCA